MLKLHFGRLAQAGVPKVPSIHGLGSILHTIAPSSDDIMKERSIACRVAEVPQAFLV